jgi:hypothetical protein
MLSERDPLLALDMSHRTRDNEVYCELSDHELVVESNVVANRLPVSQRNIRVRTSHMLGLLAHSQ